MNDRLRPGSPPVVTAVTTIAFLAALAIGVGWSTARSAQANVRPAPPRWLVHGAYKPAIEPANFVSTIDNCYFPLRPGTAFHYQGYSGPTPQTDDMVVTRQTKQILGVTCTVVRDTVSEQGKPVERTFDWYAQDKQGNVWYMGEDSLELKNGRFVRAADSWLSGVNGAKPGIIMRGNPKPGDVYRQEYYPPGGALDQARVLGAGTSVKVPYGTYRRSLATVEWSPVEPQLEKKYYAAGIGEIQEQVVSGGHERFRLVSLTH
jgi:hypothetical protein